MGFGCTRGQIWPIFLLTFYIEKHPYNCAATAVSQPHGYTCSRIIIRGCYVLSFLYQHCNSRQLLVRRAELKQIPDSIRYFPADYEILSSTFDRVFKLKCVACRITNNNENNNNLFAEMHI